MPISDSDKLRIGSKLRLDAMKPDEQIAVIKAVMVPNRAERRKKKTRKGK